MTALLLCLLAITWLDALTFLLAAMSLCFYALVSYYDQLISWTGARRVAYLVLMRKQRIDCQRTGVGPGEKRGGERVRGAKEKRGWMLCRTCTATGREVKEE